MSVRVLWLAFKSVPPCVLWHCTPVVEVPEKEDDVKLLADVPGRLLTALPAFIPAHAISAVMVAVGEGCLLACWPATWRIAHWQCPLWTVTKSHFSVSLWFYAHGPQQPSQRPWGTLGGGG